jgi:hypothetical protein
LFNVMILGVGALVANSVCPWLLQEVFTREVPVAAVASQADASAPTTTSGEPTTSEAPAGEAASGETAPGAPALEPAGKETPAAATQTKVDWRSLFLVPCAAATIAAIALALFFHPPKRDEHSASPVGHPV